MTRISQPKYHPESKKKFLFSINTATESNVSLHVHSRFFDSKANDRIILFLVDKSLQHTQRMGDCALKQLQHRRVEACCK